MGVIHPPSGYSNSMRPALISASSHRPSGISRRPASHSCAARPLLRTSAPNSTWVSARCWRSARTCAGVGGARVVGKSERDRFSVVMVVGQHAMRVLYFAT